MNSINKTHSKTNLRSLVFGCMDGHGQFGDQVTQFSRKYIEDNLIQHPSFESNIEQAIHEVVMTLDRELNNHPLIDVVFSGTALVLCVLRNIGDLDTLSCDTILVADVGDSRLIIGHKIQSSSIHERHPEVSSDSVPSVGVESKAAVSSVQSQQISIDHRATIPEERDRILAAGGRVLVNPNGLGRIYLPSPCDMPGLAMSRSIGDAKVHECGVISTPQFHRISLSTCFQSQGTPSEPVNDSDEECYGYIVLGSDGLFDMYPHDEILQDIEDEDRILSSSNQNEKLPIIDTILHQCYDRWIERQKFSDDISIILIQLSITTMQS